MLKSETETLKEENSKRRHDMCEKDISIKRLTKTLNEERAKQKWQTETRQTPTHQSRRNIPLDTRNRFAPFQNTQDEVLDKKGKSYKGKETLQHHHQTPVHRNQNHRPNLVINHFSENDNPLWQQRTVPGNSKYSDTVLNGKKTLIVGTSKVKGIRIREVNSQLRNSFAKLRSFPGATLKHLRYYIVPSLIDETPNRIILHGGSTDVSNKNSTPEKIANEIANMAILCCDYGVNDVFISAMICRRGKFLNGKVKSLNFLLKEICEKMGTSL